MPVLKDSTESLTLLLGEAISANECTFDLDGGPGAVGPSNGVSAVTMLSGGDSPIKVNKIRVHNADTIDHVVIVRHKDGATNYQLAKYSVPTLGSLVMGPDGDKVLDRNGNVLQVAASSYGMYAAEMTFTETGGAATYTGAVSVPAGATIHDIVVNGVALWDNAGAVTMKVGDVADDDGYYTAVNLKATDLLAGESISFALAGGKAGAYIANSQVSPRYSATARVISGIITAASTGGSAGRTRMTVVYSLPTVNAATKA